MRSPVMVVDKPACNQCHKTGRSSNSNKTVNRCRDGAYLGRDATAFLTVALSSIDISDVYLVGERVYKKS